jgi:hypothetical protein
MTVASTLNTISTIPCSLESFEANEPMAGSAPRADVWFMLELPTPWGNKAWEESNVAAEIKEYVNAQLKQIPQSRLMLIKQPRGERKNLRFYVALVAAEPAVLYRFELDDYSDLLNLDLVSIAGQDETHAGAISEEPVFLVCTNGRRDQCCALHGMAIMGSLQREFGELIWESTHHGGHRFAANLLAMPAGLSYGRLRAGNAIGVVTAARDGRIAIDYFRGRTRYDEATQAAEVLLRQALGLSAVDAIQLMSSEALEGGRRQVRFTERADRRTHKVVVEKRSTDKSIHLSCGDADAAPCLEFVLLEHTAA